MENKVYIVQENLGGVIMEFRIEPERIKKMITIMVREHNQEIHHPYSWWNGVLNGYLECLGLEWDVVDRIESGEAFWHDCEHGRSPGGNVGWFAVLKDLINYTNIMFKRYDVVIDKEVD